MKVALLILMTLDVFSQKIHDRVNAMQFTITSDPFKNQDTICYNSKLSIKHKKDVIKIKTDSLNLRLIQLTKEHVKRNGNKEIVTYFVAQVGKPDSYSFLRKIEGDANWLLVIAPTEFPLSKPGTRTHYSFSTVELCKPCGRMKRNIN